MASHSSPAANNSSPATPKWRIPSPYPPCIKAANELDPIVISQMKPETHHRGKRTAVCVDAFPTRLQLGTIMTTIKDEKGTQTFLRLLHQPKETAVPAEQIIRPGVCYLIKEPFLTGATNGTYCLRVDHPSDILLLHQGHELLPEKWSNNNAVIGNSRDTRMHGNNAFGKKRWAEAEDLYTTAVRLAETAEELQLAYLNRSLANLRLGRPATALADAIKSYGGDRSARAEKALFREASALYELAKYNQCLQRLHELETAYPESNSAVAMTKRVHERLHEQRTGQYDFRRMYQQAQSTPPLIDCANYTLPVEIRESPGKGRGLFTTRKVLAGELLFCEKAYGYACCDTEFPGSIKDMTELEISTNYLLTQIVQKLSHNIDEARTFGDRNHGDYDAVSVYEVDGHPVVDTFLVDKIIELTGIQAPRTSLSSHQDFLPKSGDWQYNSVGIWHLTAHINHSCISNTNRSFIGDMQIVRATRDLEEGSELFKRYRFPVELDSYEEAQERLRRWNFTCNCALCLDRKVTPKKELMQRKSLVESIEQLMTSQYPAIDIPNVQNMLARLDRTYSATAKAAGGVRLELWKPYFALGGELLALRRPAEAIEVTLKSLEALGFVISASPPRERPKSSKPEFLIKEWGIAIPFTPNAFLILHEAYKRIAPELLVVARKYLEVAYSMVMGEKETILEYFEEIA